MRGHVATKPAPTVDRAGTEIEPLPRPPDEALPVLVGDIRSSRPYLLMRNPATAAVRRLASVSVLLFLDLAGVTLGVYAALVLRELWVGHTIFWGFLWEIETQWLPFLVLVAALVFWRAGLYATRELRAGFGRVLSSLAIVALLTSTFGIAAGYEFTSYLIFPTAVAASAFVVGLFRACYESVTQALLRTAGVRRRALLVGEGGSVSWLHGALGSTRGGIDYEFVGAVGPHEAAADGLPVLGGLVALPRLLARHRVDELIVNDSDFDEKELLEIVELAHRRGVKVRIAPKTTELLTQRGEYVPGQGIPLFELRPPVLAGTDWALKRTFDLAVSGVVVALGLPLWLAIAAAIKLSSSGPVFYRDRRVGVNEREFPMLKFRTMYQDASARQVDLEESNEADGALFKIRNDPRVTPVGALLRRFSIDEIPQVWHVLRGQMSLVGPRPLPVRDFARLEPWHRKRYLVLPGLTGLWQISGRSDLSFDDLVRLDFFYLENWSIWLDISIIVKTFPAVLSRRGAY
jgi:exopolysaccharide biosynthesis polyprenyl glycosylphosphotransferase